MSDGSVAYQFGEFVAGLGGGALIAWAVYKGQMDKVIGDTKGRSLVKRHDDTDVLVASVAQRLDAIEDGIRDTRTRISGSEEMTRGLSDQVEDLRRQLRMVEGEARKLERWTHTAEQRISQIETRLAQERCLFSAGGQAACSVDPAGGRTEPPRMGILSEETEG